jgi:hypothetical protein
MIGDERVRHCAECDRNVYNLSQMTTREIERLIAASQGQRLCGRLYRRADGTMLTRNCPVGFRSVVKRVSRFAGAALSAALSVSPVAAQSQRSSASLTQIDPAEAGIRFVVVDENGALIPRAKVLIEKKDGAVQTGTTDGAGMFSLTGLPQGIYTATVQAHGFKTTKVQSINVRDGVVAVSVTLQVGAADGGALMGVIVGFPALPLQSTAPSFDQRLLPEPAVTNDNPRIDNPTPRHAPSHHRLKRFFQKLGL